MKMSGGLNPFLIGAIGFAICISSTVGLISIILREYLPVPLWVALVPAAVAFASLGVASPEVPCMVVLTGTELAIAPLAASLVVGFPASRYQSALVVESAFRLAIAADLSIMIPLAFLSMTAGSAIRGLWIGVGPPPWSG
jgi:hypothetical protein